MIESSILSAQQLSGGYGDRCIVNNIFLNLQAGEWLSLVGANGSGKSTLLRLMSRILPPTQGVVLLNGEVIHRQPARQIAQQLAMLSQQQTIPEGLTVTDLVALGRAPHQAWWQWELNETDRLHVQRAIQQTHLENYRDRPIEELSGGERQRAFLALALAQEPQVLLLDEPTTYLDIHYQLDLLDLLQQLNQTQNLTIITVLHELNLALRYSDRIALIKEGYLSAIGPVTEVITPQALAEVFGIEAVLLNTPVGLQICPIGSIQPNFNQIKERDETRK